MIDYKELLDNFETDLLELTEFMINDLKKELIDQGHVMTGRMRDSIELAQIKASQGSIEALVELENYYDILDKGVRANRIPFYPGSGRKDSEYIKGLVRFWMIKKGLSEKEATRAAFATAKKHKLEGMPTQSSWNSKITSNGRRLEFFTRTLDDSDNYGKFEGNIQNQLENVSTKILNEFEHTLK